MGDPYTRRSAAVSRLRHQLRKKRESLADHFEFKMYIAFHFKDKKKSSAVFEVTEVVPVMTNNYEETILRGVKEEAYSLESSKELLEKDVVQLHAARWQSLRKDVLGCTTEIDFFLWPRNDIDKIECHLFSRWKGDSDAFKPIQAVFEFNHVDYEKQLIRLLTRRQKSGLIINNASQSMFLFIDKHHLQTSKNKVIVFKLSSLCLYLPQDQLTCWGTGTAEDIVRPFLS
ncbi:uncharacterized protein C6orf62 homolog [Liolophura sinensis]|uniref:uncharacterized protein C6orf62 homolog n=1 Tax=Liolophura sinensis TaxID=3198878 RepID=UPI0031585747